MDPGVAALLGVVLGGLLSVVTDLAVRAVDAGRSRRIATRLLAAELRLYSAIAKTARDQKEFGMLSRSGAGDRALALWADHRSVLATIAQDHWDTLTLAVTDVVLIGKASDSEPWNSDTSKLVEGAIESVGAAVSALDSYSDSRWRLSAKPRRSA